MEVKQQSDSVIYQAGLRAVERDKEIARRYFAQQPQNRKTELTSEQDTVDEPFAKPIVQRTVR